jgi:hypothetical protein
MYIAAFIGSTSAGLVPWTPTAGRLRIDTAGHGPIGSHASAVGLGAHGHSSPPLYSRVEPLALPITAEKAVPDSVWPSKNRRMYRRYSEHANVPPGARFGGEREQGQPHSHFTTSYFPNRFSRKPLSIDSNISQVTADHVWHCVCRSRSIYDSGCPFLKRTPNYGDLGA